MTWKVSSFSQSFLSWIPSFLKWRSYWVAGFNSTFCPSTWSQQLWAESLWKLESKWILPPLFSEVIFFFVKAMQKEPIDLWVCCVCVCSFITVWAGIMQQCPYLIIFLSLSLPPFPSPSTLASHSLLFSLRPCSPLSSLLDALSTLLPQIPNAMPWCLLFLSGLTKC